MFVIVPSILLWLRHGDYFKQHLKIFAIVSACAFFWGLSFDVVGSTLLGVWSYHNDIGIRFLNLPLEEYILLLTLAQELTAMLLLLRRKIYG